MSFKDGEWSERFKALGDQAEAKFCEWADKNRLGYVRWGLDRPPLRMYELPDRVRHAPDFLLTRVFVEAQGFGRDQLVKLKWVKRDCLQWWSTVHPVWMFLWDSYHQRQTFIDLSTLDSVIADHGEPKKFPEGRPYWSVNADAVFAHGQDAPS